MNYTAIATLLAAICVTFTAANVEQVEKFDGQRLAAAPPVRGKKGAHHKGKPAKWISDSCSLSSSSRSCRRSLPSSSLISASDDSSKVCTRELEGILYGPTTNVKLHLAKIAAQIRADIQVIMAAFSGGNLEYIRTYMNMYKIIITIMGPFGQPVLVAPEFVAYTSNIMSVGIAQTYVGREGFYVDTKNGFYNYQFVLWSNDGQMVSFILSLPIIEMTNAPLNCNNNL